MCVCVTHVLYVYVCVPVSAYLSVSVCVYLCVYFAVTMTPIPLLCVTPSAVDMKIN